MVVHDLVSTDIQGPTKRSDPSVDHCPHFGTGPKQQERHAVCQQLLSLLFSYATALCAALSALHLSLRFDAHCSMCNMYLRCLCCLFHSYHRRWNKLVSVRRPSIWHFIRRLKDEERRVWRTVRHVRAGIAPSVRRCKWRRLEERIDRLKAQYSNGAITLSDYWDAIRFTAHLP